MSRKLQRDSFLWTGAAVIGAILPLAPSLPIWLAIYVICLAAIALAYGRAGSILPAWLRLPLTLASAGIVLYAFSFRFGRDTGAALLATMLALKLLETPTVRDARSVTGFALFAVLAAFLQDQSPHILVLALLATLLLLRALARVAENDLPADTRVPAADPPRAALASMLRMAAISAPLALALFLLFPRLASPLWGIPDNAESRTGLGDDMTPGDFAKLYSDDSPALRVTFFGQAPAKDELYWRGPVLTRFDGRTWTRTPGLGALAPARIEPQSQPVRYRVDQEPTDRIFLITLDLATVAPSGSELGREGTAFAARPQGELVRFEAVSHTQATFEPELDRTYRWMTTSLPEQFNPRTRALIEGWVSEDRSVSRLVERTLDLFNREFSYTLEPRLLARDSVDDFLFETREGYCEHFASAFVVMMRMAGVPARVVTGFQGGSYNDLGDYWIVRKSDAHAWAEIWVAGSGWVRVDPTSVVAPARIAQGTDALAGSDAGWRAWLEPALLAGDWIRRGWNDIVLGFNAARQRDLMDALGLDPDSRIGLLFALAMVAGGAVAATLLLLGFGHRPARSPLHAAYDRFCARLGRAGAQRRPFEGPIAYAERAATILPGSASSLRELSERYAQHVYSAHPLGEASERQLRHDLVRFRPSPEPDHGS